MSSELRVNVLRGSTANGNITIQGEGASNLGGATMQLQNGLMKSFEIHDNDQTTLIESFNMSSITDGATGICSPVFTNNMATANYFTAAETGDEGTAFGVCKSVRHDSLATTNTYTYAIVNSSNAAADRKNTMSANFGDLA